MSRSLRKHCKTESKCCVNFTHIIYLEEANDAIQGVEFVGNNPGAKVNEEGVKKIQVDHDDLEENEINV